MGRWRLGRGRLGRGQVGAEMRPEGSTRGRRLRQGQVGLRRACGTPAAPGATPRGESAPWEPNQEARLVGGGASDVCTAAASDS